MLQSIARDAVTRTLDLDETIRRLHRSHSVEGVAEFGSRAHARNGATSDYDLLIVLRDLPAQVFQIVTSIDSCIADIVPVQMSLLNALLLKGAKQ